MAIVNINHLIDELVVNNTTELQEVENKILSFIQSLDKNENVTINIQSLIKKVLIKKDLETQV